MLELKTEFLYNARFTVPPQSELMNVGDGGWGTRVVVPSVTGRIEGPKIAGTVKYFWESLVIRHDQTLEAEVRLVVETDDGALIHIHYPGIIDTKIDDLMQVLEGKTVKTCPRVYTTPRFETGHQNYLWMNKVIGVAIGEIRFDLEPVEVHHSVYTLR